VRIGWPGTRRPSIWRFPSCPGATGHLTREAVQRLAQHSQRRGGAHRPHGPATQQTPCSTSFQPAAAVTARVATCKLENRSVTPGRSCEQHSLVRARQLHTKRRCQPSRSRQPQTQSSQTHRKSGYSSLCYLSHRVDRQGRLQSGSRGRSNAVRLKFSTPHDGVLVEIRQCNFTTANPATAS